jgi:hypothetical protein
VDVERHRRLAPGELPHRAVDRLVAGLRRDHGLLPHGERMGPGARGAQAEAGELELECPAQRLELLGERGDVRVDAAAELDDRALRLPGEVALEVGGHAGEDPLGLLGERPVDGVEEHHLLLGAHGVRLGLTPVRPVGSLRRSAHHRTSTRLPGH